MELIQEVLDFVLHLDAHLQALAAAHGAWTYGVLCMIMHFSSPVPKLHTRHVMDDAGESMSEYQYYEFLAIDRPLTPEEQAEVGSLSSRTHPTPTRAVFTYSYSDFRGDPIRVLAAYFDAMLYMAN